MASTTIVIPCFDEAERLPRDRILSFVSTPGSARLLFVNDGSRDHTLQVLRELEAKAPDRIDIVDLTRNRGKAEAVRAGMLKAASEGAERAGFFDADLATPLAEASRMGEVLDAHPGVDMVLGARVQLMGRVIERKKWRHYAGRIFATVASETLGIAVYDTQCGAKLFRMTPEIVSLFEAPFIATWIFDVELIARLIASRRRVGGAPVEQTIYELPLDEWVDVRGSKLKATDFGRSILEMWRIYRHYLAGLPRSAARLPSGGSAPDA